MNEALTAMDRQLLAEIMDTADPEQLAIRVFTYYHDSDRADRTSRSQMYLHMGMLTGALLRAQDGRRPSVGALRTRERSR